ncbi:MAG: NAD(P)/FAD-dependent oxidoreductase [Bryobacteraceae bacterium]|jgi:flavin-dependent dehydrogenase
MDSFDVLIVGGGPAGSSCAWALRNSGLDVAILDKQVFPRDKVCGGWITPGVLTALDINSDEYGRDHVLQPITGFRTSCIGRNSQIETDYGRTVSYGIRRREFDDYLLKRCAARIYEGVSLSSLNRSGASWIVNDNIRARLVVGAGGHFCPVARLVSAQTAKSQSVVLDSRMGGNHTGVPVAAQETEFEMDAHQIANCDVRGSSPELYFCADMKGYGWCFRKQNRLNIGLGRADPHGIAEHASAFVRLLAATGKVRFEVPRLRGHAYFLYGTSQRQIAGDGFLLIGDSAGLARPQSGEGILPAIESALLAAETILAARGTWATAQREAYNRQIAERTGNACDGWMTRIGRGLPPRLTRFAATQLLENRWFARHVVLDSWFLH